MSLQGHHFCVTGGLGYIASHTVVVLLDNGAGVTIVDDLSNSHLKALEHIKRLAGSSAGRLKLKQLSISDKEELTALFKDERFDAVLHFAGFKAVGESVAEPLKYYSNNVSGTVTLLEVMQSQGVKSLVFSSSCTVYGLPERVPISEDTPLHAINPYGRTKLFVEEILKDLSVSDSSWCILLLRYFNPIGAHPSGELGEHPVGIPNNLMPYLQQVALGQREDLKVYGGEYQTPDGTAIRDYLHVVDLAEAHVAAVAKVLSEEGRGCRPINIGTGKGTSVLEMIRAFEESTGVKVPYTVVDKRPGDAMALWASTDLAEKELGWKAKYHVGDMCRDLWGWATRYPRGYHGGESQDQPPGTPSQ